MIKTKNPSRGFSLVEMMVVIAIIGILVTIVFASAAQARKKSRDTARIADLEQVAAALHIWALANGRYPSAADGACEYYTSFGPGGCLQVLVTAGLFTALPTDPQNEPYSGSWPNDQMYFYDNWCSTPGGNSDQHYRMWSNGELNHGSRAENWWYDTTIGKSPCSDPS